MCYWIHLEQWYCWGSNTHGENDFSVKSHKKFIITSSIGRNYLCLIFGQDTEFYTPVKEGSKLVCYGNNEHQQLDIPKTPVNFQIDTVSVSAGDWHTCALKFGGMVGCWGLNSKGQTDVEDWQGVQVSLISVKNESTCLLVGLELKCFGGLNLDKLFKVDNENYATLQLGYNHVCLFLDQIYCYGENEFGQLNNPFIKNDKDVILSSNANHTCALNGVDYMKLDCFGQNDENQLVSEPALTTWMEVVTGAKHTCALYMNYYIQCWGSKMYDVSIVPDFVANYVHKFSVGGFYSCFLRNANIKCFGKSNKGKINEIPSMFYQNTEEIASGFNHICGISLSILHDRSTVSCWGLRDKDMEIIKPPKSVLNGDYNFISKIKSGFKYTCLISVRYSSTLGDDVDMVVCWGLNNWNQLNVPSLLSAPNRSTKDISLGLNHACATNDLHDLFCWGNDDYGQASVPVKAKRYVFRVSAGNYHTCVTTNHAFCWGLNSAGQTEVPKDKRFTYVVAGGLHSCGLDNRKRMRCWGSNKFKQLIVPREFYSEAIKFGLGERHTCALNETGQYACWGDDEFGQSNQGLFN